jgi:predicted Rossmann-fold nucleotide-binding protein
MSRRPPLVAVCGASAASNAEVRDATEVGRALAERGAIVLCGGLSGVIARCCGAMIASGGGYGTLSEIAFALRLGRPVVALHSWDIRRPSDDHLDLGVHRVETAEQAVDWVLERVLQD